MGAGVPVDRYFMDNGIYTSKQFTRDLHGNGQVIRHSGVGGRHHNGVSDNAIKNVVRISRTMIIHAALRWPDFSEEILWPMDIDHAVHLHNYTHHISSGMSPEEIWTRYKSSHGELKNVHPWGCPAYVLETRLQDGKKFPKWMIRSRRAQYLRASPLYANTMGLVRNL